MQLGEWVARKWWLKWRLERLRWDVKRQSWDVKLLRVRWYLKLLKLCIAVLLRTTPRGDVLFPIIIACDMGAAKKHLHLDLHGVTGAANDHGSFDPGVKLIVVLDQRLKRRNSHDAAVIGLKGGAGEHGRVKLHYSIPTSTSTQLISSSRSAGPPSDRFRSFKYSPSVAFFNIHYPESFLSKPNFQAESTPW